MPQQKTPLATKELIQQEHSSSQKPTVKSALQTLIVQVATVTQIFREAKSDVMQPQQAVQRMIRQEQKSQLEILHVILERK